MSKREIKVGDKVRVRKNLAETKRKFGLTSEMEKMIGNVFDVKIRHRESVDLNYDNCNWCFHINDVELVEPTYTWTSKFNIGDKVRTKHGQEFVIEEIVFSNRHRSVLYYGDCAKYLEWFIEQLVQEPQVKEVTIAELEKQYGCKVKVVK